MGGGSERKNNMLIIRYWLLGKDVAVREEDRGESHHF